ncbi:MAG: hypothetical protein ABL967_05985 [Bryobacteraceae bacterium]
MTRDYTNAFQCDYSAVAVEELPSGGVPRWYYPGALQTGGRDGLLVLISPKQGNCWLGVFGFGDVVGSGSALLSTPDVRTLLVVARGCAYFVNTHDPLDWQGIRTPYPVTDVRAIPESNMILVADYTKIAAFRGREQVWITGRISFDGIRIMSVGPKFIEGEAWDPTISIPPTFRIDLQTGSCEGGADTDIVSRRTTKRNWLQKFWKRV